jgi:myo-inositol-1-phosphate synthase
MGARRIGLWLVGARGGVATTVALGLSALRRNLADEIGLVSALPEFAHLPLPLWDQFVLGGHEIRTTSLAEEALRLHRDSRVFDHALIESCRGDLDQWDEQIRPGTLWNVGSTIRQLAEPGYVPAQEATPWEIIRRLQGDLEAFRQRQELQQVVVVNLASTEAPADEALWPATWQQAESQLRSPDCPLPASTLYAVASLELGLAYVNFTPSLGATPPGIDELARQRGTCHAGRDGKTGETLLKSVLAPMFAARHLQVMSWVGHNIFGNLDGQVLDDPRNKAAKVKSKDHVLEQILGYTPQTLVTIEHIRSLNDWKTAWDHIHFRGFLGTGMTMQFTWQGCDSLLAAPLVLDLARFVSVAQGRNEKGALTSLSSFFKSPLGANNQSFAEQYRLLLAWAQSLR